MHVWFKSQIKEELDPHFVIWSCLKMAEIHLAPLEVVVGQLWPSG